MKDYYDLPVKAIKPETENAVTLTFSIPQELRDRFQLLPGQHIKLKSLIDETEVERFYSVCDYGEDFLQVGIKKVPEGVFSQYACQQIKNGDVLAVQAPQGDFHLPLGQEMQEAKQFCFLAAGSGITPILSMVRELLSEYDDKEVILFYINGRRKDIMFFEQLEDLKNRFMSKFSLVYILTREPRDLPLLHGRPDEDQINQLMTAFVGPHNPDHSYVCGPLPLIEAFRNTLIDRGVDKKNIHMELFGTPTSQKPSSPVTHSEGDTLITIMSQGSSQTIPLVENQSVLDAALDAGANVPFACKGGVCATCKAKMIDGEATMAINYGLEDDEVEKGYVLTCQTFVSSKQATFDFDV